MRQRIRPPLNQMNGRSRNGSFTTATADAGLLAGIVLVDWLAVAGGQTMGTGFAFALLFVMALIFQRLIVQGLAAGSVKG